MDDTGTTQIGKAVFNHPFIVPGLINIAIAVALGYVFGSLIIAQDLGHFDQGIAFLEKGAKNNPKDWSLPFETGFLEYVYARDYAKALAHFQEASKLPGAGPQAGRFAAFVAAKAGYVETSIAMWEEIERTSDNRYIRELAERYIGELKAGTFRGMGKK